MKKRLLIILCMSMALGACSTKENEIIEESLELHEVQIYYPDDELMEMIEENVEIQVQTPNDLFEAWEIVSGVETNANVISFEENTIDLSQEFAEFIWQYGSSGEYMYVNGMVSTFKAFYDVKEIYITIDGGLFETGHAIYDFAL